MREEVQWPMVRLEDCCDILDNRRVPLNDEQRSAIPGRVPYYGANGVQGYIDKFIFDEPLILLAEDGGNFDDYQNRPIAYRINGKSWVNNHAHILRAKSGTDRSQDYIFYCLEHKNITPYIKGGTRAKLNKSELNEICIPDTTPPEQQRIAEILSTVDEAIEQTEALIAKTQQIKAGLMHDLFTRGVTPDGKLRPPRDEAPHLYKKSPLGWIPKEWSTPKIRECLFNIIDNRGKSAPLANTGHPVLEINSISANKMSPDFSKVSKFVSDQTYNTWFRDGHPLKGDILIPTVGSLGICSLITGEGGSIAQNLIGLRFTSEVDSGFAYFFISSPFTVKQISRVVMNAVQPSLKVPHFLDCFIAKPLIKEQKIISDILMQAMSLTSAYSDEVLKLKQKKSGLMHDLLTGHVRVPVPAERTKAGR